VGVELKTSGTSGWNMPEHGTTSGFRLQGFWQRISRGRTAAETCSIWESSNMFKVKMMKLLHVFVCIACSVLQCEVQASLLSSFSGAASNHLQPPFPDIQSFLFQLPAMA
jgi:hypothetical protein